MDENGLSDEFIVCDDCDKFYKRVCSSHGPLQWIKDSAAVNQHYTRAWSTLPRVLSFKNTKVAFGNIGVFAAEAIETRVKFGPFIGRRISAKGVSPGTDQEHMWDIFCNWKPDHILDATDEEESNWMRFVKTASHKEQQNLVAFQYCGELFFRTCREIKAGEELLVWYEDEYCCELDQLCDQMMTLDGAKFSCKKCNIAFLGSTILSKHNKYRCDKEKYDCWICQEEFPSRARMVEHIEDHMRVQPQTEEECVDRKLPHIVQEDEVCYECKECRQSFRTKRGLCNHNRCHTLKAKMPRHGKICTSVTQIKEECAERKPPHIVQQGEVCYECKECRQSFRTKRGLCNHSRCHTLKAKMSRHGKIRTQGKFKKLQSFKTHSKVNKKRTLSCKSCGRWCGSKIALEKHTGVCHWNKRNSEHMQDALGE